MIQQDFSLRKAEHAGRLMVPHLLVITLLLLNVTALPILPMGGLKPQFVLMAVYYWAIYRPTLMPPLLCFVLGIVMDVLSGMPTGINALILVAAQWIVRDQRRFLMGQPYSTIWAVFGLVATVSAGVQWALYGLAHMHWSPLVPVGSGLLLTVFLFPFISLALVFTHRILPVASRP